jgi:alpha-L-arabinofuranosidase
MFKKSFAALALLLAGVPQTATPQSQPAPIPLTIRSDAPGATISRHIFGQFAEMLGEGVYGGIWVGPDSPIPNVRGIRSDVVAALRDLHVPNVRWPGGCHADRYDWRDGIGPNRRARISMWGNVVDPNTFGTHEFMDFIGQIEAEAFINVNMGSNTAQHAGDWLEYMTSPLSTALAQERIANGQHDPWKIRFVGLGNETWGCGGEMSADHNVEEMKRFSTFVSSHHPDQVLQLGQPIRDPMIRIAVGQDLGKTAFSEALMRAWRVNPWTGQGNFDALSLHYYTADGQPLTAPATGFDEGAYARTLQSTLKMEDMITENLPIMDRYDPAKKVALSIDEWGVWLRPEGANFMFLRQQNSIRDAIAASLNFDIFIRHADRVRMANIAQMVNVIQSMILTDGAKMVLTPTYYVHRMYVPFQDATLLPVQFNGGTWQSGDVTLPRIDAVAARDKQGAVWLALTNVDPNRAAEVRAAVPGIMARAAVGEMLSAPRIDSVNTFDAPGAVVPRPVRFAANGGALTIALPPKSVTVVRLEQ